MKWSYFERTSGGVQQFVQENGAMAGLLGVLIATGTITLVAVAYNGSLAGQGGVNTIDNQRLEAAQKPLDYSYSQSRRAQESRSQAVEIDIPANPELSRPAVLGQVQVDNTVIPIPQTGAVQEQIVSSQGTANVTMSVNSSNTSTGTSSQQTTIDISIDSQTQTGGDDNDWP